MKTISIFRWLLLGVLVPGFFALLAYLFFPFAYLLRKQLRAGVVSRYGLIRALSLTLWIFLDDEEYYYLGHDYGADWWREAKGLKTETSWQKLKAAYLWGAVRNPAWNHYYLIHPKFGELKILKISGGLKQDGHTVNPLNFAVLKYVDEFGNWMDNKGEYLSLAHSILGKSFVWYKIENRLYFRYSFAGKRFGRWIELQLGTNDRRYTFRFKIKKVEVWEECKKCNY